MRTPRAATACCRTAAWTATALFAVALAGPVAAQTAPPGGQPPPPGRPPPPSGQLPPPTSQPGPAPTQPGSSVVAPAPTTSPGGAPVTVATTRAANALAQEAAALVELGGLGTGDTRLAQAVSNLGLVPVGGSEDELLDALRAADDAGQAELDDLVRAGVAVTPDVEEALGALPDSDYDAAADGTAVSVAAETYLRALDHLVHFGGGPPEQPAPPDSAAINAALAGATPIVSTGGDGAGSGDGGGNRRGLVLGLLGLLALLAIGGVVVGLGRRRRATDVAPIPTPVAATTATESAGAGQSATSTPVAAVGSDQTSPTLRRDLPGRATMQDLLDVSRRLTAAAATGDIDRTVVRHALDLVHADGAALVRQEGDRLWIAAESQPDLLVPEAVGDGAIRRVAETGQPHVQVSGTEPAIRHLPASLAAVPLVGGGRVEAVLVIVRDSTQQFSAYEQELLQSLAPVAAAALTNASQARAAREDSLVDPLTQVGNRRRFDTELHAALAAGDTTSLFIADLDRFKSVNDTYGHPAGDALLKGVSRLIRETVRPDDSVYRFGGEEFCVLLRETPAEEAAAVAERVRAAVEAKAFDIGKSEPLGATASFGVSDASDGDAAALLARADAALYRAKESGRNRVEIG